jgi:hypothetical protein
MDEIKNVLGEFDKASDAESERKCLEVELSRKLKVKLYQGTFYIVEVD